MDWAQIYVVVLACVAIALLATEKAHLTVIGIALIAGVAAPGLIDIKVAVAGFSNTAVVTVGALYVVGEGFLRTGAAASLAKRILERTGGRETTVVFLVMIMSALLSAFVNNTLVVVTFMPVITSICRETGLFPSRLLIPLSYASIVGGMCTLVGTSTNLLVSGVLENEGLPGISMFEMTLPGIMLAGVAMLYIGLIGRHLLPKIPSLATQSGTEDVREYVTEITIGEKSTFVGSSVKDFGTETGSRAAMLVRNEKVFRPPFRDLTIAAGDILVVAGRVEELASLHHDPAHTAPSEERFRPSTMSFFELALTLDSAMVGRRVRDLKLKQRHGAVVIGLMRNGHHLQARYSDLRLRSGDVLLAFGDDRSRANIRHGSDLHVVEGVAEKIYHHERAPFAIGVILAVVTMFVTGLVQPCTAALLGALGMVTTGCLTVAQATRAVNWGILIFIAGTLALSQALQATGAAAWLGQFLADTLASSGGIGLLIGVYAVTIILTETLSNNAVAVLMTPVALAAAQAANIDYRPIVLAVAFGASTSFANPMGYKTNLLVYGPGGYRFMDFVKVGLGLDLVIGALGVLIIPWFWDV